MEKGIVLFPLHEPHVRPLWNVQPTGGWRTRMQRRHGSGWTVKWPPHPPSWLAAPLEPAFVPVLTRWGPALLWVGPAVTSSPAATGTPWLLGIASN